MEVLKGVEGISFVQFDEKDVVRHTLVQRIVKAYEKIQRDDRRGRQLTLHACPSPTLPALETAARRDRAAGLSPPCPLPKAVPSRSAASRRTCARGRFERFARKLAARSGQGRARSTA